MNSEFKSKLVRGKASDNFRTITNFIDFFSVKRGNPIKSYALFIARNDEYLSPLICLSGFTIDVYAKDIV